MTPTALEIQQHEVPRPAAKFHSDEFRAERPQVVGPESPEAPFPIFLVGEVQRGFGRGGKDLGCPTGAFLIFTKLWTESANPRIPGNSEPPGRVDNAYE